MSHDTEPRFLRKSGLCFIQNLSSVNNIETLSVLMNGSLLLIMETGSDRLIRMQMASGCPAV